MGKSGKNPFRRSGSPFWHIYYRDASGVERRESTRSRDLRIARKILADRQADAARKREGFCDPFAESRRKPVDDFVLEFRKHLQGRGNEPKYVKECVRQLRSAFKHMDASRLEDLDLHGAERFLVHVRESRSARTRDHHAATLRGFGRWLLHERLWPENPFERVPAKTRKTSDRKYRRRPLGFEELQLLVAAAEQRPVQEWKRTHPRATAEALEELRRRGSERGLLYMFVGFTGLRKNECAGLTWSDLQLDGADPAVSLRAEITKNRQDSRIPLVPWLARALRERRKKRGEWRGRPIRHSDPVFHVPDKIARLVREDAAWAGLGEKDPTWHRLDFHALRGSFATLLATSGVHPRIAQELLRHADIRLTMEIYTTVGDEQLRTAVGMLPSPSGGEVGAKRVSDGPTGRKGNARVGSKPPGTAAG